MDIQTIEDDVLLRLDLKQWEELCLFLDDCYRKCAYQDLVPAHLRRLVYKGGNSTGEKCREDRWAAGLIFYYSGWGWRLRKNWRTRLAALVAAQDQAQRRYADAHRWDEYPDDYDESGGDIPF